MSNSNKKMVLDSPDNQSQVISTHHEDHVELAKRKKTKKRANLVVVGQNIDEEINVDDL
jgi:hypothetical protein